MDEGVLDRLIREAEASGSDGTSLPSPMTVPEGNGGTSPLVSLMANPAVLSVLPKLLGSTKGGSVGGKGKTIDRHTALLCALKPYLSRERQAVAEQLIGVCRLWDTLQGTGLLQMLPAFLGGASSTEEKEV